jgi:hypothetical protein
MYPRKFDDILNRISEAFGCEEEEYAEAQPEPLVIDLWRHGCPLLNMIF